MPSSTLKASVSSASIADPVREALDGAGAEHQLRRGHFDGIQADAHDYHAAPRSKAADQGRHGFAARHGGENDAGPAQRLKSGGRVFGLAVDVMVGPQLPGQRLLFRTAGDGRHTKTHPVHELDAQMPEAADALDRHEIAGPGGQVSQRVIGRHAGAQQGRASAAASSAGTAARLRSSAIITSA